MLNTKPLPKYIVPALVEYKLSNFQICKCKANCTHRCHDELSREAVQAQCKAERDDGGALKGHGPSVNSP